MMLKSAPLNPPKRQKHRIWGEESRPSPKFDSSIVAFGGGWEGASFTKLILFEYLEDVKGEIYALRNMLHISLYGILATLI